MDFWGTVVDWGKKAWDWGKSLVDDVDWADVAGKFAEDQMTKQQSGGGSGRSRGRSISLSGRYSLDVVNPSTAASSGNIETSGTNAAEIANAKWSSRFLKARRAAIGTVGSGTRTITSRTYMKRPKELG